MNDKLLRALKGKNTGRPPVWLMRQAGRYMPAYRALRERYSFLQLCHEPDLISEVTRLPIDAFGVDAAILFSDILVIPEALGVGLHFDEGKGPIIDRPLRTLADIQALPSRPMRESLGFVAQGIRQLLPDLQVPLIGFCGAPFTVASYMIEGGSSKDLRKTKQWMIREPAAFHLLLDKLTEHSIDYLSLQVEAGVNALQVFDSWANFLAPRQFSEFSLPYLKRIVAALKKTEIPVILFSRGSSVFAPLLAQAEPAAISLDWNGDLALARKLLPKGIALQGNLDPDLLYAPKAKLKEEVGAMVQSMRGDPAYIFNLGHGIHPDTPIESVQTLIESVHRNE